MKDLPPPASSTTAAADPNVSTLPFFVRKFIIECVQLLRIIKAGRALHDDETDLPYKRVYGCLAAQRSARHVTFNTPQPPEPKRSQQLRGKKVTRARMPKRSLTADYFIELSKLAALSNKKMAALWLWIRTRSKTCTVAIAQMMQIAVRGASSSARNLRPLRSPRYIANRPQLKSIDVVKVSIVLTCICLGLLSVGAVVGMALLVQTHRLKTEIAQMNLEVATSKRRLVKIETSRQTTPAEVSPPITKALPPRPPPLTLTSSDIQTIRQFIKVAPPSNPAQQTINVGDDLSKIAARPVPEPLVDALPKLQGARFSIDQVGAIIIIAAGSNQVDAVISYR